MIGASPTHVPVVEASVEPTEAVPEIVGVAVFAGTPFAFVTCAVAFEVAVAFPSAFVAVTSKRIVAPRSAETSGYLVSVAPAIAAQLGVHRSQR